MHPPEDPFTSIVLYSVPTWLDQCLLEQFINSIPAIIQVRAQKFLHPNPFHILVLDFPSGTDVSECLEIEADTALVNIDHTDIRVELFGKPSGLSSYTLITRTEPTSQQSNSTEPATTHPRLRLEKNFFLDEPECRICRTTIDGPFSTPCISCRCAQCYECVRTQFSVAMKHFECFPAKCCNTAFHPDVAKGILSATELTKYKTRFEERFTKLPFYCPVPTCSAFIPQRVIKQRSDKDLRCPGCHVSICYVCKQLSHLGSPCPKKADEEDTLDMMKRFGYKQCPKCGIAVGKMYGCSHVKCKCGAHWCYECRRKIEVCNSKPCDGSLNYEEDYLEADDEVDEGDEGSDYVDDDDDWERKSESNGSQKAAPSDIDSSTKAGTGIELSPGAGTNTLDNVDRFVSVIEVDNDDTEIDANVADVIMMDADELDDTKPEADMDLQMSDSDTQYRANLAEWIDFDAHETTQDTTYADRLANQASQSTESQHVANTAEPQTTQPDHQNTTPTAQLVQDGVVEANKSAPEQDPVNLDDPRRLVWEHEALFFGEEPSDDDTMDIWGCAHHFENLSYHKVPRYWMTASIPDWWERDLSEQKIECMMCWRAVKVAPKLRGWGDFAMSEDNTRRAKNWNFARRCMVCSLVVCKTCKNELAKA